MREIDVKGVSDKLRTDMNVNILNVLDKKSFDEEHIPGSLNVPLDNRNFIEEVEKKIKDKAACVIVYCSGPECHASLQAGKRLEEAGFSNILHFKGGMEEWKKSDEEVKSSF